ncbi:MAG: MBL fold metallo-hydrolase [bacterium]|nr:MBL fold metallo-hydrolase [bacterium]
MSRQDAVMKKEIVGEGNRIHLYTFTDYEQEHTNTLTVIVDEQAKGALVIDPAYPEFAEQVDRDLQTQGITVKAMVISHYHPDHAGGCSVLPKCAIYASEFYEYNLSNCQVWDPDLTYLRADHLLKDGDSLTFGGTALKFLHAPGHSKCSLITELTGKILHVGDLIMTTRERKNSLPYISDGGSFEDHIKSLELIKKMDPEAVIFPHGGWVDNKTRIHSLVDDRLYYLEKVLNSKGELPLNQCLKNDISWYDLLGFHDTNVMQLL